MATDNNLSVKIPSQLPSYLQDEGPNLVAFMKAYYQWMESSGQVNDRAQNLLKYNDVDDNIDAFVDYFNREILSQFPSDVLADRRLLMKNVRELYRTKGSEAAYQLLFRLLYDEEITLYYPGNDVLRTSDGRWVKQSTILLSAPFVGDPSSLGGLVVTGSISGATATVVEVETTIQSGLNVFKTYLENISGTFVDGETVSSADLSISATILNTIATIQDIDILFGGANNQIGDTVTFSSLTGGSGTGTVASTTDSSLNFTITDGGSGYTTNSVVTISDALPGSGANFTITSISNTEIIAIAVDTIQPVASVVLNTGPTFVSAGANTSSVNANFAAANVSSTIQSALTFQNTVFGSISTISVVNGSDYTQLPAVAVTEPLTAPLLIDDGQGGFKGQNAVITPSFKPGAITDIDVVSSSGLFVKNEKFNIVNQSRSADNAKGTPVVSGVSETQGGYVDTKGFLSWDKKLQDGYFYQQYSYVIQSQQNVNAYRKFVKNTIHPAGQILFGEKDSISTLDVSSLGVDYLELYFRSNIEGVTIDNTAGPTDFIVDAPISVAQDTLISVYSSTAINTATIDLPKIGIPTISTS